MAAKTKAPRTSSSGAFRAGRVIAPDAKWTGDEPEWKDWQSWPIEKFFRVRSRALNFYNYYCDASMMRPMVLEWMKKEGYSEEDISMIREAPASYLPSTVGKLIRCMEKGMPSIHPNAQEYFNKLPFHDVPPIAKDDKQIVKHEIGTALNLISSEKVLIDVNVKKLITPLDRIKANVERDVISVLDQLIDKWTDTSKGVAVVNLQSLINDGKIPPQANKIVADWLNTRRSDFLAALEKTDDQLVEGYSYLTKTNLKLIISSIDNMLGVLSGHAKVKAAQRKPRKKKVKDATKQISSLKYQINSSEYNLDSINPVRIPAAQLLYTFNTKTRALCAYYASGQTGFEIKGTSLKGIDMSRSYSITLRKPNQVIPNVLSMTHKQFEVYLDSLKVVKKEVNGRINDLTILLKVSEQKV